MGKKRARRSAETSKESTPVRAVDSEEDDLPAKKKPKSNTGKTSATLQDVELEYSDADFQNLTTFSLFVRLFRPQISAVNPKATSSQLNQMLEGKWREFQEAGTRHHQQQQEQEEAGDTSPASSDKSEDSDSTIEEEAPKKTRTKASLKKNIAAKRGVVMPSIAVSEEDSPAPRSKRAAAQRKKKQMDSDDDDSPAPSRRRSKKRRQPSTDEEDEEEEEEKPRKKSSGFKVKLSMASSQRKSGRERKQLKKRDEETEKFFEEDSDTQDYSSAKKKKKKAASSEDEFDSPDSETEVRKKKSNKKQTKRTSSGRKVQKAYSVTTDSSDGIDSEDSSKKKPSKKSSAAAEKPHIPGERQSQRDRKRPKEAASTKSIAEMTDKEFNEMLKKRSKEEDEEKARKAKARAKRAKEKAVEGKKGAWQDKDKDSGEESDHYWYCGVCKDGGDLLLCDGCPRSYHQRCLKLEEVPEGEWKCPVCKGEELPDPEEEEDGDTGHDTKCKECRNDGELLLCDFCTCAYHLECLNPVLLEVPDGEWKCPRCVVKEKPLKGKVEKILTWRWSYVDKGDDGLDHTHSPVKKMMSEESTERKEGEQPKKKPEKMLFVKFQYYSYWDCEWISLLQLEVFQNITSLMFRQKWDQDEPPAENDLGAQAKRKHAAQNDKYNLYERYIRWGIKYDWLQIHRILTHEKESGRTRYLVKWRERPYEEATYEEEGELPEGLQDWKKHVNAYWLRRKQVEGGKKRDIDEKKPKKKELKKQWEVQPDYIDRTGGKLHPYQLEGVNWMRFSYGQDTNTILADEMGLGKTVQAATFIYSLWKEGYAKGPFLISAPLSTVANWEREFEFWAPDMYVVTYIGGKENRAIIREREMCYREGAFKLSTFSKPSAIKDGFKPKFDVLLTSYEYPSMDFALLSSFKWSILVIDEAHRLKSNQSLFFRMMSKYHLEYRLLLTGTPLQNNLEELFNLLNFLERDKFTDLEMFLEEFSDIGKEEQVVRLHEMLAPHMLRRLKIDVLKDMPKKSEFIVRVELSPMQKKFYKLILTKNFSALNVKGYSHQTTMMNIMMDLRKCCNHPYLFASAIAEAPTVPGGAYEGTALIKACGKLELLAKMLKKLRQQKHRVLIFSQMTRVLDLLEDFMLHMRFEYERIDGGISGNIRQERIDRFNDESSSSFVFLLSTKAGGLGINLATADTVVIYDMDWNPHNDIQAFSRAHRIGQKNKVMIYRFVCRNSVEERMAQVCKQKMMLSELVIAKGKVSETGIQKKTESLSKQELNEILKFGAENLFKDDESGKLVYDDEAVDKMLDRDLEEETVPEVESAEGVKGGLNDYLRSFKVATYRVKEDEETDEEEEETREIEAEQVEEDLSKDHDYWQRVLGEEYSLHMAQLHQQQEELARTLGKGKRIRKQINYAEQAMMEVQAANNAKQQKKRNIEVITQREDDEFQPTSSDSASEDDPNDPNVSLEDMKKKKKERKKEKREKKKDEAKENELPPLLARVNGKIEVLGFCARQRRAFLDAVMRFGMPPEDAYHSQWLVRDLKHKRERVFRAYVSLFMRHLCEPMSDDSQKFADGVPREGMSQQHVLTRIGIIALIRSKVSEYESTNKTHSMAEFRVLVEAQRQEEQEALEKKLDVARAQEAKAAEQKKQAEEVIELDEEGEKGEKEGEKGGKEGDKAEKEGDKDGKEGDKDGKEGEKGEKEGGKGEKEDKKGEKEGGKEGEKDNKDSKKDSKEGKKTDKEGEKSEKEGEKGEKDSKKGDKDEEKPKETEESMDTSEKKETSPKKKAPGSEDTEKEGKKKESPSKETDKKKEEEGMETDEKDKKEKEKDEESKKETEEDKEKSKDEDQSTSKEKESKKEDDKAEVKEKDGEKDKEADKTDKEGEKDKTDKEDKDEDKSDKDKDKEADKEKDKEDKTDKDNDKEANKTDKPEQAVGKKMTEEQLKKYLRERFWIADGGFTELHAVWAYEEGLMDAKRPYEHWHRRHDYWLLAGVVSHGYRHWQDILSDPRFEILNRAFRTEQERLRKAAFLNRRFQLLEQALVIEEQLRKASVENSSFVGAEDAPSEEVGICDRLAQLDNFAATLRRVSQGQATPGLTPDAKVHKAINNLSGLINDVKAATYKTMPATLAKAPPAPPPQQQQQQQQKARTSSAVITID